MVGCPVCWLSSPPPFRAVDSVCICPRTEATGSSQKSPSDSGPFISFLAVPSAPPRKVEVEVLNSTAIQVFWRSPVQNRQHGQIRGYQVHYVRMENGEARGLPQIKDIMLADAQVRIHVLLQFVSLSRKL